MGEHSPTPWVLMKPAPHLKGCLGSAHGFYISSFKGETETPVCNLFTRKEDRETWTEEVFPFLNDENDAAHIVHCVNSHGRFVNLIQDFVDTIYVPERNCSCHLHPPCSDCVENGQMRELLETANSILKTEDKL